MAAIQIRTRDEGADINTTDEVVQYRPVCFTDSNNNVHIIIEQLLYWKAGSKGGMDPADPRKVVLPGAPGEWIFLLGGPLSRPYDPDTDPIYNYDATPSPEYQDVSWAYYTAYAAHEAYIQSITIQNPAYAMQRNADWFASNPISNDEAFVETPLPVEPVPPIDYGI